MRRPRRMVRLCSKPDSAGLLLALAAVELPDGTIPKTPGSSSYGPLPKKGHPVPANPRVESAYRRLNTLGFVLKTLQFG